MLFKRQFEKIEHAPGLPFEIVKHIFVLHAQGAMKHGRIRGVHRWTVLERVSFTSPQAQILDYGSSPLLAGHVPDGNVRLHASYHLGKPKALPCAFHVLEPSACKCDHVPAWRTHRV